MCFLAIFRFHYFELMILEVCPSGGGSVTHSAAPGIVPGHCCAGGAD